MSLSSRDSNLSPAPSKVAAVCYRRWEGGIEFLLVRTSSGKWTFPKGNVEPDLPLHGSAQLEAFEEAGAIGDIAKASFEAYLHRRAKGPKNGFVVLAYLMEVRQMIAPERLGRRPTWFRAKEAKVRLSQRRRKHCRNEFARVIDKATYLLTRSQSLYLPVLPDRATRKAR